MSQGLLAQQRQFCRAQCKAKDETVGRKKRWEDNEEWTEMAFASSTRQLKTGLGGKGLSSVMPQRPHEID